MAKDRTDWAEDRTLLANERTFAGWMRTGLASAGVGLALRAIFGGTDPTWLAKSCSSVFLVISLVIFFAAWRSATRLNRRLDNHAAVPLERTHFTVIVASFSFGVFAIGILLWLL